VATPNTTGTELVGMAQIAELLGVSRPRIWQLRAATDFPAPAGRIGSRDYFTITAIHHWMTSTNRHPQPHPQGSNQGEKLS
jgi:predicted DNA-binding transcriptional regulator AlpA